MENDKLFKGPRFLSRRDFLAAATALAGTGVVLANATGNDSASTGTATEEAPAEDANVEDVNLAIIGCGAQGRVLVDCLIHMPGIKIKAVCDIWEFNRRYTSRYLKRYGHELNDYEDYREMLEKEKDLQAVIIATPDFVHAEHTVACLEAGLHVYCEKEMSNTIEGARAMVEAQRRTGKLLQIGHQRRSNPRYQHVVNNLIDEANLLGRVNHAYGQWNRSKSDDLTVPRNATIPDETLKKYGYDNMHEFRNWRWYKKYSGGPIVDLGSHQIDIFSWVYKSNPIAVTAVGGKDYYEQHEWYDNVYVVYDYKTPQGIARALYKILTTTKYGLFYEVFMGDDGALEISELAGSGNSAYREDHAPEWEQWVEKGWIKAPEAPVENPDAENTVVDVRASKEAARWTLPVELNKPAHQPHLENFMAAIRDGEELNCPAEIGYETAVAVLKVNEAVEAEKKLFFDEKDFVVS